MPTTSWVLVYVSMLGGREIGRHLVATSINAHPVLEYNPVRVKFVRLSSSLAEETVPYSDLSASKK